MSTPQAQNDAPEQNKAPLPLPPPSEEANTPKLNVGSEMKFDALGPLVVNSDGTLSRIANWPNMTPFERERTIRVLSARNQIRIADQKAKLNQDGGESQTQELSS